jgi:hypothetical protein
VISRRRQIFPQSKHTALSTLCTIDGLARPTEQLCT